MRELFFANDTFSLFGEGDFNGTFHMFKGGRELKGDFTSARCRRQRLPLPQSGGLAGLGARSHGGDARDLGVLRRQRRRFTTRWRRSASRACRRAREFDVDYTDVDLDGADRLLPDARAARSRAGPRAATRWRGRSAATPSARARARSQRHARRPASPLQGPRTAAAAAAERAARTRDDRPVRSATTRRCSRVAVAGEVTYAFDPRGASASSRAASSPKTPTSRSRAPPRTGERSKIPFRVTSRNWQESDRMLAGIMTAFGASTKAIADRRRRPVRRASCSARSGGRASRAA